jgi:hypothetical protein
MNMRAIEVIDFGVTLVVVSALLVEITFFVVVVSILFVNVEKTSASNVAGSNVFPLSKGILLFWL